MGAPNVGDGLFMVLTCFDILIGFGGSNVLYPYFTEDSPHMPTILAGLSLELNAHDGIKKIVEPLTSSAATALK